MDRLKELLLPVESKVDFSEVKTRPKLQAFSAKLAIFFVLFTLLMIGYTLVTSLTYQQVAPDETPAYNLTRTIYSVLDNSAELMLSQGVAPSFTINTELFVTSFTYVTDCLNIQNVTNSYYLGYFTENYSDVGCTFNATITINMQPGQIGSYYLVSLNGFDLNGAIYPTSLGSGDLVWKTTGIVGGIYTTTDSFEIISGIDRHNLIINTGSNVFTTLVFDFNRIFLFGLSASGVLWKFVNIVIGALLNKWKNEIRYGDFVHTNEGFFLEV